MLLGHGLWYNIYKDDETYVSTNMNPLKLEEEDKFYYK